MQSRYICTSVNLVQIDNLFVVRERNPQSTNTFETFAQLNFFPIYKFKSLSKLGKNGSR